MRCALDSYQSHEGKYSRPAIPVNVKQKLKQPIGDRFGIQPILQNTLLIASVKPGRPADVLCC
jgi:hypothetical protein